jgi:hypothetical protein
VQDRSHTNRTDLRTLRSLLDERWPKLAPEDAERWLGRVKDGRSPYNRVRSHAIRCQLDANVALALHLGLRRAVVPVLMDGIGERGPGG